jgi:hypothetical protein
MQQLVPGVQEIFFSVDCFPKSGRFLKGLLVFCVTGKQQQEPHEPEVFPVQD